MRIGIVVDSACDLPREFLDQHGVLIMPITLRIGDALIEDRRHPEETQAFYARHLDRKSEDFAESIPYSVAQIERLFLERLVLDYDYVFCLTITSTRSPIFDHAMQASRAILTKYKAIRRDAGMEERFGLSARKYISTPFFSLGLSTRSARWLYGRGLRAGFPAGSGCRP